MKLNYIACIGLTIFRVLDIVTTIVLVGFLGFAELNPLGFNPLSVSLILAWTAGMWFLARYIGDNEPWDGILFILIMIFAVITASVVGWNIRLIIWYYT